MPAAISTSSRGARKRSSAASTSGTDVVALSSTAPPVPSAALAATVVNVARPAAETLIGPRSTRAPPARMNGTSAATHRTAGSTSRPRDQTVAARTRASAAIATSARAQATNAGHACSGVETATSVTPVSPISFARGSSRWTGLAGSPASPGA